MRDFVLQGRQLSSVKWHDSVTHWRRKHCFFGDSLVWIKLSGVVSGFSGAASFSDFRISAIFARFSYTFHLNSLHQITNNPLTKQVWRPYGYFCTSCRHLSTRGRINGIYFLRRSTEESSTLEFSFYKFLISGLSNIFLI